MRKNNIKNWISMFLVIFLTGVSSAWAQYYQFDDSVAVEAAYPWIDISTTGTGLTLTDDQISAAINIGFTFNFGGANYTQVSISSNGMLQFAGTDNEWTNSQLPLNGTGGEPNIDAVMLALWDDHQPGSNANRLRHRTQGTAPNRVFIVSWIGLPRYCSGGTGCTSNQSTATSSFSTFQIQIYEDGKFVYRYGAIEGSGGAHTTPPNPADPGGAVGVEISNADFVQYSFNTASVPNGRTILWFRRTGTVTPGEFNAFETTTAANAITGVIKTEISGIASTLAVVALNTAGTAVETNFTGNVKIELLNASNNTGALNTTTNCRSTWTTISTFTPLTVSFAALDNGRTNFTFTENNAWQDVRIRISFPATGTATVIGCSTDNFAIRPATFANFSITDADSQTAGTTRSLNNILSSGGNVHKAGRPFTLRATAVNGQSSPATTTNYGGVPSTSLSTCSGTGCTTTVGTISISAITALAGVNTVTASYDEVGSFSVQLVDQTFANVDASDGSTTAERFITSAVINAGRFVPNHFELTTVSTPILKTFDDSTCTGRSFTYIGQPFGYVTVPQVNVIARNFAGGTTTNYSGTLWKLTAASITQTYAPLTPLVPTLNISSITAPSITSNNNGTGLIAVNSTDKLSFTRSNATPQNTFNANISATYGVVDTTENAVTGNGTINNTAPLTFNGSGSGIAFDSGNNFRFGRLQLANVYGSELLDLPVRMNLQYWNGTSFVALGAVDSCTKFNASDISLSFPAFSRNHLSACETTVSLTGGLPSNLKLIKPGNGNDGWANLRVNLGATASGNTCISSTSSVATTANKPYLRGNWGVATFDQDPTALIRFGAYRTGTGIIYFKENY